VSDDNNGAAKRPAFQAVPYVRRTVSGDAGREPVAGQVPHGGSREGELTRDQFRRKMLSNFLWTRRFALAVSTVVMGVLGYHLFWGTSVQRGIAMQLLTHLYVAMASFAVGHLIGRRRQD